MNRPWIFGLIAIFAMSDADVPAQKKEAETGSALSAKEVDEVVNYHNKVRKDVGVDGVKWSPEVAKFAQAWADKLAESGELEHRPVEGEWKQKYGENIAINQTALKGAEAWYSEIKDFKPGTAIPEDFSNFTAGHYTQMVWKKTTIIGCGSAVMKKGQFKGLLVIVCNYDPPGNFIGEKPY